MPNRSAVAASLVLLSALSGPPAHAAQTVRAELVAFATEDPQVGGIYDASYNCTALADRTAVFTFATCELTDASGNEPLVTAAGLPGPFAIAVEPLVSGIVLPATLCAIAEATYEADQGPPIRVTDRLCRPLVN